MTSYDVTTNVVCEGLARYFYGKIMYTEVSRPDNPRSFITTTSLFFLRGLITVMNDVLIPYRKECCDGTNFGHRIKPEQIA